MMSRVSPIGIIPAHAGKTGWIQTIEFNTRDHPRSRGENRPVNYPGRSGRRIIPAHAGKTLPDLRFYRADRSDLGKP